MSWGSFSSVYMEHLRFLLSGAKAVGKLFGWLLCRLVGWSTDRSFGQLVRELILQNIKYSKRNGSW